jgi:uncharacterized OsmC-like protein
MLEYRIAARRVDGGSSVTNAKMAEVRLDTGLAGSPDPFNPAELLLAANAACMIKGIKRVMPMLKFRVTGVEVSLHAVWQDAPPRIISADYELVVDTDESDQRLDCCTRMSGNMARSRTLSRRQLDSKARSGENHEPVACGNSPRIAHRLASGSRSGRE